MTDSTIIDSTIIDSTIIAAPDLPAAADAIDLADRVVGKAVRRLARSGGPDVHQVLAYDIAHAASAVATARSLLDYGAKGDVEAKITCAFAADMLHDLAGKVLGREDEWGVDRDPLADAHSFIRQFRAPQFLASLADRPGPRHLDSDMEMVADSFGSFAHDVIAPHAEHVHRTNGDVPEEIVSGLAELGAFGLSVPAEYGGFSEGGDTEYVAMVVATEELSKASLGIGGSLITRPEILTRALVKGGTEAQKRHWLPKLATAEVMPAVAVTEPDYGSDVAGIKVTATPAAGPDGEAGWVINGVKTWCTFGARADALTLLARTDPDRAKTHRGLSLFIVPKPRGDSHGFQFTQDPVDIDGRARVGKMEGRPIDTIGYRGMHSYEIALEDWWVPADNQVGGPDGLGKGFYYQMAGFENGRLQTAARAVGVMQAAYEAALDYAEHRKVFGERDPRLPAHPGKARADGRADPGGPAVRVRRRHVDGQGGRSDGGVDGEGVRLQGRRMGQPGSDADPRRDGLRRGVPGESPLRRCSGALDLRRRRRDVVPQGDRPRARRMNSPR